MHAWAYGCVRACCVAICINYWLVGSIDEAWPRQFGDCFGCNHCFKVDTTGASGLNYKLPFAKQVSCRTFGNQPGVQQTNPHHISQWCYIAYGLIYGLCRPIIAPPTYCSSESEKRQTYFTEEKAKKLCKSMKNVMVHSLKIYFICSAFQSAFLLVVQSTSVWSLD